MIRTGARGRQVFEDGGPTSNDCCDEVGLGYIRLALFTGDRGAGRGVASVRSVV
jgi:hypothetical protein